MMTLLFILLICFKYISRGSSSGKEQHDLRCFSWVVSFNMTVELVKIVPPPDEYNNCESLNNRKSQSQKTIQDACEKDENCKYSSIDELCSNKATKNVYKTYKVPDPSTIYKNPEISKTLETSNLQYNVNNNNTEVQLTAKNIHCLDWEIQVSSSFQVNKRSNSITFTGEKCQEFVEIISPKTLDDVQMNTYQWVSLPSVGTPIIENGTLRFDLNETRFQGCEQKTVLEITCVNVNGTAHKLGPFNGTRIDMKSLQDEQYEMCHAIAYMRDSPFKSSMQRQSSPSFRPSGQIYEDDGNMNLAIMIPSAVGGAIVGLFIIGNIY